MASPELLGETDGAALWFAVQVKTTHEKKVALFLGLRGVEYFLPVYACKRHWSDRVKQVERPLFPGYIFSRFSLNDRIPILKTPSVQRIVGIGSTPIPIPENEIGALQRVSKSGNSVMPHPFLELGQRVRIDHGPLAGLEGYVADFRQRDRLIISVTLLRRSVAVEIDSTWVTPAA